MINRAPMPGMQARQNEQSGRMVGVVHYGRNPQSGARQSAHQRQAPQPRFAMQQDCELEVEVLQSAPPRACQQTYDPCPEPVECEPQCRPEPCEKCHEVHCHIEPAEDKCCAPLPESLSNPLFLPGYLRCHIGKTVHAEFLIGRDMMAERTGILADVGANYITLRECNTQNLLLCDIHALKFITVCECGY